MERFGAASMLTVGAEKVFKESELESIVASFEEHFEGKTLLDATYAFTVRMDEPEYENVKTNTLNVIKGTRNEELKKWLVNAVCNLAVNYCYKKAVTSSGFKSGAKEEIGRIKEETGTTFKYSIKFVDRSFIKDKRLKPDFWYYAEIEWD